MYPALVGLNFGKYICKNKLPTMLEKNKWISKIISFKKKKERERY
jgi:hypothetical protein